MSGDLMKLSEIATLLHTERSTPYRWVQRGLLPALKTTTGMLRVRREDLEAFIRSTTKQQEVKR